jgi:hypothetical protein
MKRDAKTKDQPAPKGRLLKLERSTIQQLETNELENVVGGRHSHMITSRCEV